MKLLFLDIDGVLNSMQSCEMFHRFRNEGKLPEPYSPFRDEEFCPICVSNLLCILEKIEDLKIVISSTWRIGTSIEELQEFLGNVGVPIDRIIGKTPILDGHERGDEIADWLKTNGHEETRYAVLDDDSDMTMVWDNFFQIDNTVGLNFYIKNKVIEHLKEEDPESTERPIAC